MPHPVRPPPDVQRIVREAHAMRARYIAALLRALAAPRRDPRSSMRGARS